MNEILDASLFWVTRSLEVAGILVIVLGSAASAVKVAFSREHDPTSAFRAFRAGMGRSILLGLEFLVAADIINTVAIEPTLESLGILGGIVFIRTFLSFALEVEIEGRFPWRRDRQ